MRSIGKSITTRVLLVALLAVTVMGQKCYNVRTVRALIAKHEGTCQVVWLSPKRVLAGKGDVVVWTFLNLCDSAQTPKVAFTDPNENPFDTNNCALTVTAATEIGEVGVIACVMKKRPSSPPYEYETTPGIVTTKGMPEVVPYP